MTDFGDFAERVEDARDEMESRIESSTEDSMRTNERNARQHLAATDSEASGRPITAERTSDTGDTPYPVVTSWRVAAPWPYAAVEYGTGPRGDGEYPKPSPKPPIEPIVAWIVEKNISPEQYDTVYGLASAIQDTIGMVGTHSYPFMRPMWRTGGRQRVLDGVERAMSRSIRRM